MICQDCKNGYHEGCPSGTWCDCQHRMPEIRRLDQKEAEAIYADLMGGSVTETER